MREKHPNMTKKFVDWDVKHENEKNVYILRKTIEGYLDSVPSLTFNTIKTNLIMHAFRRAA